GLVYGLMALGLSVIFGVAHVVNFAHGEMMTLAMYASVILFGAFELNPFIAVLPVAVIFFFLGYGLQRWIVNPFVTRPEHTQFMLLLAIAIILTNGQLIIFGPDARSVRLDSLLESIELGALLIDRGKLYAALVALSTAAALLSFFRFTRSGTAIRACADNWLGAKVVGLNVKQLYALAFGLGSVCVAVAGCMMILLVDLTPSIGPGYTLLAFVIVIVGGLGSMNGALVGGVLIGLSEALAGLFILPSAKSMFSFALLIVVLLLRPRGLLGGRR
ncbi:MAG: branched-chain amino acid ABC transporter permease, partial [Candidatus Binatia bacterium]